MAWDDEFAPVDEDARRRFEKALRAGHKVDVADFLPNQDSELFGGTLEELVLIDLEFRWKKASHQPEAARPSLEDYLEEYPPLADPSPLLRLVREEVQIRQRAGESPNLSDYEQRFPQLEMIDTIYQLEDTADTSPHSSSLPPTAFDVRYQRLASHASGGMGEVYRAADERFDREVALKQLRPAFANQSEARARFVNEARLAGKLEHPGIVPVYDIGVSDDGAPYYVMKLVEGQTLEDVISDHHEHGADSEASLRKLLAILMSVSNTIAYAHDRGVIHRDLKPANIVVGNYGETVVLDWGLAKELSATRLESQGAANESRIELECEPTDARFSTPLDGLSHKTQAGAVLGTPAYMPPEQAEGSLEKLDHRADVYGLGAILFHILTGRPPVTSRHEFEQLASGPAPRARSINTLAPRPLDSICSKAMAMEPGDRYIGAAEFGSEIERYLADMPVQAHSDPSWVRVARWSRRHRALVASSLVALLLLTTTGVAGGFIYQSTQAKRARQAQIQKSERERLEQRRQSEREREISTRQTAIGSNDSTARDEIRNGRFANALQYLGKAIDLCGDDAAFAEQRRGLEQTLADANRLNDFETLVDRAELFAWEDQDDDVILYIERALEKVHAFEHPDWWNHITPFELSPEVLDRLRQRVYRELGILTGIHLKRGALRVKDAAEFKAGGNELSRADFKAALIPLEAARRFRPGVGLDFADALCAHQLATSARAWHLVRLVLATNQLTDFRKLEDPSDKFFVGISMLVYSELPDADLVALTNSYVNLKEAGKAAVELLGESATQQPQELWTAFAHAWALESVGEYRSSITALGRCIALDSRQPRVYLDRARQFMNLAYRAKHEEDDPEQANEYWRRTLLDVEQGERLAPADPELKWRKYHCLLFISQENQKVADDIGQIALAGIDAAKCNAPTSDLLHVAVHREVRDTSLDLGLQLAKNMSKEQRALPESRLFRSLMHLRRGELGDAAAHIGKIKSFESASFRVVRGEIRLNQGKLEEAKADFEAALTLNESEYLAHRGIALVAAQQDPHNALPAFRRLASLAESDWQKVEALRGSAIAAIHAEAYDQALADVEALLQVRPSAACDTIRKQAEDADPTFLKKLDDRILHRSPEPTRPLIGPGTGAALFNGGFELPLNHYWNTSREQPVVWWNRAACRSNARTVSNEKRSGAYALLIRHQSLRKEGRFGSMSQRVPTTVGATYEVQVWAKCKELAEDAFRLEIGGKPVITLPAGTSNWKLYTGRFTAEKPLSNVSIASYDQGAAWLDDLEMNIIEVK